MDPMLFIVFSCIIGYLMYRLEQEKKKNAKPDDNPFSFSRSQQYLLRTIEFSYKNADGEPSRRAVDVKRKEWDYFSGFCHLRRENRTFRYDRIEGEVVVVDTGEIISPSEFAGHEV